MRPFWWKHLSGIYQVSFCFRSLTSTPPFNVSRVLCFPLKTLESVIVFGQRQAPLRGAAERWNLLMMVLEERKYVRTSVVNSPRCVNCAASDLLGVKMQNILNCKQLFSGCNAPTGHVRCCLRIQEGKNYVTDSLFLPLTCKDEHFFSCIKATSPSFRRSQRAHSIEKQPFARSAGEETSMEKKGIKWSLLVLWIKERLRVIRSPQFSTQNRMSVGQIDVKQRMHYVHFFAINAGPFNQESFILGISFGDLRS